MNRISTFAILSVIAICASSCKEKPKEAAKKQSGPLQVRVAPVRTREIQRTVESVGTLFAFDEAIVSAEIAGRLDQVMVDLGDSVTQGQPLARIGDEEQRYMVAQQEAQLKQSLERLGLRDEKDRVSDLTKTPDVRRARADLTEAEQRFRRTKEIVDQGIGPKSDLDQAQARYQAAQAAYDQTLNQTRNLIAEVERFKASLDLQRKKLRDTTIRAPFAGFVKDRQAVVGQVVQLNTPLFTVVNIDPIRLKIEVPERLAPWIQNGQLVEVNLEAYPDRTFQGRVWRISPTVDQTKRTFIVEAIVQNPGKALKPGSYARAKLNTGRNESIRMVPTRAIAYVLGSNKAYVVKPDNTIEVRDIKLGDRFPQEVEVLEGINPGERVAVTNLNRLDNGVAVQVVEAAPQTAAK